MRFCHCYVNEYTFDIFAHMASALQLGTCIIDINKLSADDLVYKDASDGFKLDSKRLWWGIVTVLVIRFWAAWVWMSLKVMKLTQIINQV